MDERDHTETARHARALLDPDDPPRSFFVGVGYDSGSDFAHGVNKASIEQDEAALDVIETLATHLNLVARVTGQDRKTIAAHALEVARGQEAINDD
jgi:hypothetical protein